MLESYFWKNALKNVRGGFRMNFSSGENKNWKYLRDGENKFDSIALENYRFLDEENYVIPDGGSLKRGNLALFKNNLNDEGRIYFQFLKKNKYLYNFAKAEFEKNISIIYSFTLFPFEYLLMNSHKIWIHTCLSFI